MSKTAAPPGSHTAIANGCTCPVLDNANGAGVGGDGSKYGFWMNAGCPLHGVKSDKEEAGSAGDE